jgi:hypothetical protein
MHIIHIFPLLLRDPIASHTSITYILPLLLRDPYQYDLPSPISHL